MYDHSKDERNWGWNNIKIKCDFYAKSIVSTHVKFSYDLIDKTSKNDNISFKNGLIKLQNVIRISYGYKQECKVSKTCHKKCKTDSRTRRKTTTFLSQKMRSK